MSRKREIEDLNAQVDRLVREKQDLEDELQCFKLRLSDEYARHRPYEMDLGTDRGLRLGDNMRTREILTCRECDRYWPCPEWHAYRRVNGWDTKTYKIVVEVQGDLP